MKLCIHPIKFGSKPTGGETSGITQTILRYQGDYEPGHIQDSILGGQTVCFSGFKDTGDRKTLVNWESSQIVALDNDSALNSERIYIIKETTGLTPNFTYNTFSSTPEIPRLRTIFYFDSPITNLNVFRFVSKILSLIFPCEHTQSDPTKLYFGANQTMGRVSDIPYSNTYINIDEFISKSEEYLRLTTYPKQINRLFQSSDFRALVGSIPSASGSPRDNSNRKQQTDAFKCSNRTPWGVNVPSNCIEQQHNIYNIYSKYILKGKDVGRMQFKGTKTPQGTPNSQFKSTIQQNDDNNGVVCFSKRLGAGEKQEGYKPRTRVQFQLWNSCIKFKKFIENPRTYYNYNILYGFLRNLIYFGINPSFYLGFIEKKLNDRVSDIAQDAATDISQWKRTALVLLDNPRSPVPCSAFECEYKRDGICQKRFQFEKPRFFVRKPYEYVSLSAASSILSETLALAAYRGEQDMDIRIIRAEPGIGKTESIIRLALKDYILALPRHSLVDEVARRYTAIGKEVTIFPEMPVLMAKEQADIERLYDIGLFDQVKRYLESLGRPEIREYLARKQAFDSARGIRLITHERLFWLKLRPDERVIIDEDPIFSLCKFGSCKKSDFYGLKPYIDNDSMDNYLGLVQLIKKGSNELVQSKRDYSINIIDKSELSGRFSSDVISLLSADYFISCTGDEIRYVKRRTLPGMDTVRYTILSGSISEDLYRILYPTMVFEDIPYVRPKGRILQCADHSYSKTCRYTAPKWYTRGKRVITLKSKEYDFEEALDLRHYGGLEGSNDFSGKEIVVANTWYPHPVFVDLMACCLGLKTRNYVPAYRNVSYNGAEFRIMTYGTRDQRRVLQLALIDAYMKQAIGRGRLIREDCVITVFSNFYIPGAELVTEDKLAELSSTKKQGG